MSEIKNDTIRNAVRENYAKVAEADDAACCEPGCCEPSGKDSGLVSIELGYSKDDVSNVPEGANMGLGCGNPQAIASIKAGETVLDLGSGGGFDCFLAAKEVGDTGRVIGVDMTPSMISKARSNADKSNYHNVEFRLGEIEHLPVSDESVDVIISNCVINLSPDKQQVFNDAFRVLKSGGRLAVSDVVATAELPADVKKDMALFTGCMAGAELIDDIEIMLKNAGFKMIKIDPKDESQRFIRTWAPGTKIEDYVISATIEAVKP